MHENDDVLVTAARTRQMHGLVQGRLDTSPIQYYSMIWSVVIAELVSVSTLIVMMMVG